jgi:hypothetical protein
MSVIFTMLGPDNKPHIYPIPEGMMPEDVAERHGLKEAIWEYCESETEAARRMSKDPNGKVEPI